MYAKRIGVSAVALCMMALVVLTCGRACADVLLKEDFEYTTGSNVDDHGWTQFDGIGTVEAKISDVKIDNGKSASSNQTTNNYRSTGFILYPMQAEDVVEMTWVEKLPEDKGDNQTQSGAALWDAIPARGGVGGSFWRMYLARNRYGEEGNYTYKYQYMCYAGEGGLISTLSNAGGWIDLPPEFGTHLDAKIEVTTTSAAYYLRKHGDTTWTRVWQYNNGMAAYIVTVEFTLWDGSNNSSYTYIDSIKVESNPGKKAINNEK